LQWDDTTRVTKERFPEAIEKGLLPNDGKTVGISLKSDVSKTEKVLGIKAKTFEQMITDLIGQYVELAEKEKK